jgi:hypothetical protein
VSSELVYEAKLALYDFPSNTDEEDAIKALLRMQFMYDLRSDDVRKYIRNIQWLINFVFLDCRRSLTGYYFREIYQANNRAML